MKLSIVRNKHKTEYGEAEGRRTPGKHRRRGEDNIAWSLEEM
jgi:hypothetical protein